MNWFENLIITPLGCYKKKSLLHLEKVLSNFGSSRKGHVSAKPACGKLAQGLKIWVQGEGGELVKASNPIPLVNDWAVHVGIQS